MGWGRTLFLGDIGNRLDIADTEQDIEKIRRRLHNAGAIDRTQDIRLKNLERENDQLKLYLASLVRLLVSRGVVSEAELTSFVDVIDIEEGA